jgi:hypothetical protein
MTSLTHPSVDFPGPPTVTLEVPDGWEPVHRPGLLLAAKLPREGRFAPNVVVGVEACPPGFSAEEPMGRMRELARSRAGQASETYAAQLGEHEFVGCDSTWPDETLETILQANLFHVLWPRGTDHPGWLVQLTGAVAGPSAEADYELIRDVIMTARVTPWTPGIEPDGGHEEAAP